MGRHKSDRSDGMPLPHPNQDEWLMVGQRTTDWVNGAALTNGPPIFWRVTEPSSFLDYVYRVSVFAGACSAGGEGMGGKGGGMPIVFEIKIASAIAVLEMA